MDIRIEALKKGLDYLDVHTCGEGVVIAALAAIAPPAEIGREAKSIFVESHKIHVRRGNLKSASASLHLAARVNEGRQRQENTLHRRGELIMGVVSGRRRNKRRLLELETS